MTTTRPPGWNEHMWEKPHEGPKHYRRVDSSPEHSSTRLGRWVGAGALASLALAGALMVDSLNGSNDSRQTEERSAHPTPTAPTTETLPTTTEIPRLADGSELPSVLEAISSGSPQAMGDAFIKTIDYYLDTHDAAGAFREFDNVPDQFMFKDIREKGITSISPCSGENTPVWKYVDWAGGHDPYSNTDYLDLENGCYLSQTGEPIVFTVQLGILNERATLNIFFVHSYIDWSA